MTGTIRRVAVLGSGIMGSGIAALLAGAGIPSSMLDIVPTALTSEEAKNKLTLSDPVVRNRIAARSKEALQKARPPLLFDRDDARLITAGNLEDHLEWLTEADWVVEAVVENLEIKKQLLAKIAPFIREGTIISSNTSGISINAMAESLPPSLRPYFLGTHFFNPVRYMKLLEIIPGRETSPETVAFMADFGEKVLGKGIVFAKDTPNFIANRIGIYGFMATVRLNEEFTVEEIDALTGPLIGRAKSATFRTVDMVGIDTAIAGSMTVHDNITDPEEKELFTPPPVFREMQSRGLLGLKSGGGFYKTARGQGGKRQKLVLNPATMEYEPQKGAAFPVLAEVQGIKDPRERVKKLSSLTEDKVGRFIWNLTKDSLLYAAAKIPEISDNILNIDNAMRWGFNYAYGPFETWDALGVEETVARMEAEGSIVPAWVKQMLAAGCKSFYTEIDGVPHYYCMLAGAYVPVPAKEEKINLSLLKKAGRVIAGNSDATLIDIGDGVACLEMHSPANVLSEKIRQMLETALEEMKKGFLGLVITSAGNNFCVGGDINYLLAFSGRGPEEGKAALKTLQDTMMKLKYSARPIVAAPFGMTLGGGLELCMHTAAVQAFAETNMGLVEVGVGLIPGSGGTKEALLRQLERIPGGVAVDARPFIEKAFQNIMQARVSMSAKEAFKLGYLRPGDGISINRDHQIFDAKKKVLSLVAAGYTAPERRPVAAVGEDGVAALVMAAYNMKVAGLISDHDYLIAKKVAFILGGGYLKPGTPMNEEYLLGLERQVFVELLAEEKTQERMNYMLSHGKPLRN